MKKVQFFTYLLLISEKGVLWLDIYPPASLMRIIAGRCGKNYD